MRHVGALSARSRCEGAGTVSRDGNTLRQINFHSLAPSSLIDHTNQDVQSLQPFSVPWIFMIGQFHFFF